MDDPQTLDLLSDLVTRLRSASNPSSGDLSSSIRYARRLVTSRLSPSISPDEHAMAESIKRNLAITGRSSDALTFADLHSKLSARSSQPGSIQNRWALLYLLKSLSDKNNASSNSNTIGGLPSLPIESPNPNPNSTNQRKKNLGFSTGILHVSKDPENVRENAMREYSDLVMEGTELEESALVRDVLYACQGIDGRYIRYIKYDHNQMDGYDLPESITLPKSTKTLVKKLCELGWLFKKVQGFITDKLGNFPSKEVGTIGQAFCSALQDELTDYYKLLAILESHSMNPIPNPGSDLASQSNYVSLTRLSVWLAEPIIRMRLMAVLVDSCKGLKGGALAGVIYKNSKHGDPIVKDFMKRVLKRICAPLFEMVKSWVLEGELEDYFCEFFITSQQVKAESLWQEGYKIDPLMLPNFISNKLAQRIFRTGKSINFLRVCCEDNEWVKHVGTGMEETLVWYGETDALETLVLESSRRIDEHLMHVIYNRYKFKDHCIAIKKYLLLGQGDFVQSLMHEVGPDLYDSANKISIFQLMTKLETSIRASNAQYDDRDILDRLKIKLIDYNNGDMGWDVFSLEYESKMPLDAIFNESVMKKYLKICNYLFKLKRVEHDLTTIWKRMKPNFIISRIFAKKGDLSISLLRKLQVLSNEMNHFVTNFQYYIMFEVLEVSWVRFLDEMEGSKDFDDLLNAHERYLSSIIEKSLLGERSSLLIRGLFAIFDVVLRFKNQADGWLEPFYTLQSRLKSGRGKLQKGVRNLTTQLDPDHLRKMGEDLDQITKDYSKSLDAFIKQLPLQKHVDLKFLFFRLDFSEFYSRLK